MPQCCGESPALPSWGCGEGSIGKTVSSTEEEVHQYSGQRDKHVHSTGAWNSMAFGELEVFVSAGV